VRKNESGMTLVEVLATLTLLSMVTLLIWTAFFISSKHNIAETTKVHLQQEANYILTKLQQQHRHLDCYQLKIGEDKVELVNCDGQPEFNEIISSDYKYGPFISDEIEPKTRFGDLTIKLIVKDPKENSKLKVEVESIISRYQSDN